MTASRRLAMCALLLLGCGANVKEAVKAYGTATNGAAQAGVALVTECQASTQDAAAETRRIESCERAKKTFTAIATSADQLQSIK